MANPFGRKAAFRSALLVTGSTYVTYATGLVVSTLIARGLGPADYGRYAYLVWLAGLLIMLFNNGLNSSGIRFVSECLGREDPRAASDMHGWLERRHHVSLVVVTAAFVLTLPLIRPAGWEGHLAMFAAIALVSAAAKAGYLFKASIAKGYGLFNVEAITTNVMSVVSLAGTVLLWVNHAALDAYLWLFVGVSIGHTVLTYVFIHRAKIHPTRAERPDEELLARVRTHLVWSIVLTLVAAFTNKSVETFMLNSMAGPEAVGFFSIAAALTRGGVDLLSSGLSSILMPVMAHAYGAGGMERVNRITSDAVRYYHFLGLLLAGVGSLWAAPLVTVMYGTQFTPAILALQVMVLVGGLTLMEGAFWSLLSTTDHQRVRVWVSVLSVVVTGAAAFALIPHYGLMGALAAHAVSRLIVFVVMVIGLVTRMGLVLPVGDIVRMFGSALCGAAAAGAVLLLSTSLAAWFAAGIVYAAGYLGGSLALRVWHARDLEGLASLAGRVPRLAGLATWLRGRVRTL